MANRPFVLNHSCIAIEYAVRREKLNVLLGRQALMPIVKGKKSTKMFSRQFPHFEKIMFCTLSKPMVIYYNEEISEVKFLVE